MKDWGLEAAMAGWWVSINKLSKMIPKYEERWEGGQP
jgi:hypothetical protein